VTLDETLAQVFDLLQRQGRVSYRALKRRFDLDDEYIEDLKAEIIQAQRLAVDEDGAVLVWTGESATTTTPVSDTERSPLSYTPRHLAEKILTSRAALEGERKQVTVLFADIKGSMALLEDLDPEEARRIIDPALQRMMDAVHRYEGYVAQTMGDGILALFGAPIAHEDHPQRALYAALHMQEASKRSAEQLRQGLGVNVQIRVGVNTGEVVVRAIYKDDLHIDYVPVGHSTGLAARMETLATPGSILVTEHTYKRTEGYFDFHALGTARIKGVSEPVPIYEVAGVSPLQTRFQVATRHGLVPFVGRQPELAQIQRALALVPEGQGQIVAVVGEPGVGKSRLAYEFKLSVPRHWLVLETFSMSHGKAFPYLPLIELLKDYFAIIPHDDERTRREKVGGKVLMLERRLEDTLPSLFALLGIAEPGSFFRTYSTGCLSPNRRRAKPHFTHFGSMPRPTRHRRCWMRWTSSPCSTVGRSISGI
jgi:class 3 adenylate cyclase